MKQFQDSWAFYLVFPVMCIATASAATPEFKWAYNAHSTVYSAPLLADMNLSPGQETIISDAEVRVLRCIGADGRQLWEYGGGWKKRLTSTAALRGATRDEGPLLLIGGSDGLLCCLDAATGRERWTREVGSITWSAAIWADLNGDGAAEVVAGAGARIATFDADGSPIWSYQRAEGQPPLQIQCPLAVADVDGDGRDEIFGVDRWGPFCLNDDGTLLWESFTDTEFQSTAVIADADGNGAPELYCCTMGEAATVAFDARTGDFLWRFDMLASAEVYSGSSLAVGDIDRDGFEEIGLADRDGHVYLLEYDGTLQWSFSTEEAVHAAVTMGDVDGDGDIEVLVASGDHGLYCLSSEGVLEWCYEAGLRLISPATLGDVEGDGKTDILFCGSDGTLQCLTLGGVYDPASMPWPSRRFDAAQSGSAWQRTLALLKADVCVAQSFFGYGGFEQAKPVEKSEAYPSGSGIRERRLSQPRGWRAGRPQGTNWALDREVFRSGGAAVRVSSAMEIASDPIPIERALRRVDAAIYGKGPGVKASRLRWSGTGGVLREDRLVHEGETHGWKRFAFHYAVPPKGARWISLVCETGPEGAWWDDAEITGTFVHSRRVEALVNQVGYDIGAPKRFNVQSNFLAGKASFSLLDAQGDEVHSGSLEPCGRIVGAFGHDWGSEYWRGDFSDFNRPGRYSIQAKLDGIVDDSWSFEIGEDLLWVKTVRPAYRFFYYQRCGCEVPGYHEACHLDDGAVFDGVHYDLSGGWHDAGDYNTYHNAPYVYGLVRAYGAMKATFDRQDEDGNGRSDFLDEILWGGDHSRRMIAPDGSCFGAISSSYGFWGPPELETDNVPQTGDERPLWTDGGNRNSSVHQAAMAMISHHVTDKDIWVEAADRGLQWSLKNEKKGVYPFAAAVYLYAATRDAKYKSLADELFPAISPSAEVVDAVRMYDALFGQDHSAELRKALVAQADGLLNVANNPFGVWQYGSAEKPNYFNTHAETWTSLGSSFLLCPRASAVALAYQYEPDPRYLAFVYDQLNWVLGNNPFDISLMEGSGSAFVPTYHNRILFGGVARGAIPGSVINGICATAAGDDRPYADMSGADIPVFLCNECWLPHNTNYLNALVNLQLGKRKN